MKHTYVQAVLDLLASDTDTAAVLRGLETTLKARGHKRLYAGILQAVLRVLSAKRPTTFVVVARESDRTTHAAAIAAHLETLGTSADNLPVYVDDTLIGGHIVEHNFTRTDASYKQALARLYRNVTRS